MRKIATDYFNVFLPFSQALKGSLAGRLVTDEEIEQTSVGKRCKG